MAIRTSDTIWEDSVDPTVNDDSSAGLQVGDQWRNTATGEVFEVTNVSVGAAQWYSITDIFASLNPKLNYVLVKSPSDLPAAVSGVRTLADNTIYEFNGSIDIGTDRIVCGVNNVIKGGNLNEDKLISSVTSAALITASNKHLFIENITLTSDGTGSTLFAITGSGVEMVILRNVKFANNVSLGSIGAGLGTFWLRESFFESNADGLTLTGNNGDILFVDNLCEGFTGTATVLTIGLATYHTIIIDRNMFEVASGQTALNIASGITFDGGAIINANAFEGAGSYLIGITADEATWRIIPDGNVGIPGLLKLVEASIKSSWSTTGTTMIEITGEDAVFVGDGGDYQANGSTFKAILSVEVTHDQAGQDIAFEVYNTDDNVPMGFGSNAKGDVDTIAWQSGNTIRYTFNGVPDLSDVKVGDQMTVESATNASNNGVFVITAVNDGSDWIEVTNPNRTDATDDEATDSPATAYTGSVTYHTNTSANVYELVQSEPFLLDPSKNYSVRVRRASSGGGNPSAYIRRGVLRIFNY